MRYTTAEKLEIIRLVEQSSLSVTRTLDQIGIPRSTFYTLVRAPDSARARLTKKYSDRYHPTRLRKEPENASSR